MNIEDGKTDMVDIMGREMYRLGPFHIRWTLFGNDKAYFCEAAGSYPTKFLHHDGELTTRDVRDSIYFQTIEEFDEAFYITHDGGFVDICSDDTFITVRNRLYTRLFFSNWDDAAIFILALREWCMV